MTPRLHLRSAAALAVLVSACADPVGPDPTSSSLKPALAVVGDRSEWTPAFSFTVAEGESANGVIACLNGGQGENSWWTGTVTFLSKLTVTKSGNVNFNFKYQLDDVRLIGWETGDVWTLARYVSHFPQHIKQSDGHLYTNQADNEWFVNDRTGERVKLLWLWRIEWDENFNVVSDESRFVSCAASGEV